MADKYDFGLIGLGVMGQNYVMNVADANFRAIGFDQDNEKVEELKKKATNDRLTATDSISDFISALARPRKIMLLVPAGKVVDMVIDQLVPHLEEGDLIIDGGNTYYKDTNQRIERLAGTGIKFLGVGISGGWHGARFGPSMMAGGPASTYEIVAPIFEATAAKVNEEVCVGLLGAGSAGNYVKMVHNGIEYALMQLIAEVYSILKTGFAVDNEKLQELFISWNNGRLNSYLIEITGNIFGRKDDLTENMLVDMILDKAGQKGTGRWTSQEALALGIPIPTIDSAVVVRAISAVNREKINIRNYYTLNSKKEVLSTEWTEIIEESLLMGFILAFTQGMHLLREASTNYGYHLDLSSVAAVWRGGCIIRASLLEEIRLAYFGDPDLSNLMENESFAKTLSSHQFKLRKLVKFAISKSIAIPALSASLAYFDAYNADQLPLNLVQAQRDYFGSHTYKRTDRSGDFHTDWQQH